MFLSGKRVNPLFNSPLLLETESLTLVLVNLVLLSKFMEINRNFQR